VIVALLGQHEALVAQRCQQIRDILQLHAVAGADLRRGGFGPPFGKDRQPLQREPFRLRSRS
jgi:hypothetical protein